MPKGKAGRERTHCVSVRLSPEELAVWKPAAGKAGHKELAAWIRRIVNERLGQSRRGDVPTRQPLPQVDRLSSMHLRNLGTNLNQLARVANRHGRIPEAQTLERLASQARMVLDTYQRHAAVIAAME